MIKSILELKEAKLNKIKSAPSKETVKADMIECFTKRMLPKSFWRKVRKEFITTIKNALTPKDCDHTAFYMCVEWSRNHSVIFSMWDNHTNMMLFYDYRCDDYVYPNMSNEDLVEVYDACKKKFKDLMSENGYEFLEEKRYKSFSSEREYLLYKI